MTTLSTKAINDLKITLRKLYGENFCKELTDEEFEEIGLLLLTALAEGLKLKVSTKNAII